MAASLHCGGGCTMWFSTASILLYSRICFAPIGSHQYGGVSRISRNICVESMKNFASPSMSCLSSWTAGVNCATSGGYLTYWYSASSERLETEGDVNSSPFMMAFIFVMNSLCVLCSDRSQTPGLRVVSQSWLRLGTIQVLGGVHIAHYRFTSFDH